jgi:NAD+ kinase
MIVGVITNESKDADLSYTREVCDFLQSRGARPVSDPMAEAFNRADFWVVLGGDGTILRTSRRAAIHNIPILGINLGTLGFLTDVERYDGLAALGKALRNETKKERRLMLEVTLTGETTEENELALTQVDRLALNDVYLSRGGFGKLISLDIYINGQYMDSLRADGVIVSTPTGSTAYNLSAGGPILMPDGDMMVITPLCPHSLYIRPWVIASRDEVKIVTHHKTAADLDGDTHLSLEAGAELNIRRSAYMATILKTSDLHFYEILRRKMHP